MKPIQPVFPVMNQGELCILRRQDGWYFAVIFNETRERIVGLGGGPTQEGAIAELRAHLEPPPRQVTCSKCQGTGQHQELRVLFIPRPATFLELLAGSLSGKGPSPRIEMVKCQRCDGTGSVVYVMGR